MAKFLDIHEEAVQSYIREGGAVSDMLNDVAQHVKIHSVSYIRNGHTRSGRLWRGIWWNRSKLTGPLTGVARAGSSARHTPFFMEDTRGKVVGKPHMVIPKRRTAHTNPRYSGAGAQKLAEWNQRTPAQKARGKGVFRADTVRGYRAHPFLQQGLAAGLAKARLK